MYDSFLPKIPECVEAASPESFEKIIDQGDKADTADKSNTSKPEIPSGFVDDRQSLNPNKCNEETLNSVFKDDYNKNNYTVSGDSCTDFDSQEIPEARKRKTGARREKYGFRDDNIILPKEFWHEFWTFRRTLENGWTDDFVRHFKHVPHFQGCILKFEYHRSFQVKKIFFKYFYVVASCKNSLCTSYRFETDHKICKPFCDITMKVYRTKVIEHDPSKIYRRYFKHKRWAELQNQFKEQDPCVVRTKMIQKVVPDVLKAGNRDDAPSLNIFQKISSDMKGADDLDPHPLVHTDKLAALFRSKEEWSGLYISGYIQNDLAVKWFSENQILFLVNLLNTKVNVFANFDATGSIVAPLQYSDKPIFYYALILPGNETNSPLPLADFLSNVHTVPQITYFLSSFWYAVRRYTKRKIILRKIETDFDHALIISCIKSFNEMELSEYLSIMHKTVIQKNTELPDLTIVHVCSSHMLKTVIRKAHQQHLTQEQRSSAIYFITQLISLYR